MTATANLDFDLIDEAQADKEVTANETFTAIDAAFSELAHTMTDANYTLSTSTTPQEWQYKIINLTGTLTADRDVIAPLNKKEYTVVNDTTGGFSIVFKTSAGAGVTVLAGNTATVRCDGTDIVSVVSSAAQPLVMVAFYPGVPLGSALVMLFPAPSGITTLTFDAAIAGSSGKALTAATAQTDFDVRKNATTSANGTSVGTIRFAAAGTVPTFIAASGFTLTGGTDWLTVWAPATPDATLADISASLYCTR